MGENMNSQPGGNLIHICDRFCYRFSERISQGLLKNPNLRITRLTVWGVETTEEYIEFDTTELKVFIPIFNEFYLLRDETQDTRIAKMKDFILQLDIRKMDSKLT